MGELDKSGYGVSVLYGLKYTFVMYRGGCSTKEQEKFK